jgi:tripartite-type tricarboxylate transporter receptor subunit TctC
MIGSTPNVLVVHPSQPMKNVGEFVAYARANPGKLSYGSSGVGASPHLSIELLKTMTGIDIVHVPYKGAAPALADVMGGQMPASVGNLPGGPLAAIKSGRVRGIGVTSAKRNPRAPDIPTFAEAGVAGYDVTSWYGICAPAGLTKSVLAKFNAGLVKVLSSPDLQQRMSEQGIDVTPSTPEQFLVHVKAETAKWAKVVKGGPGRRLEYRAKRVHSGPFTPAVPAFFAISAHFCRSAAETSANSSGELSTGSG